MKKPLQTISLIVVIMCATIRLQAQIISSITYTPANPTILDTIYVYANCIFNSGTCEPSVSAASPSGNVIYAYALHCLGPLTVICSYTDTFKLDPLPVGNYTFLFQVDEGFGQPSCSPGIVPGPVDSVNFVVTPALGIEETATENNSFSIFPNPANGLLQLNVNNAIFNNTANYFSVYAMNGQLIKRWLLKEPDSLVDISSFPNGVYPCAIENDRIKSRIKKLVVIN